MKNKKMIIAVVIIAIVLLLGVAYAAISNITLNITGSASGTANQSNFSAIGFCKSTTDKTLATSSAQISYTATTTPPHGATITATATNATTATVTVSGLTTEGDTASIDLYVANNNADLNAKVKPAITNNDTTNFTVTISPSTETTITHGTAQKYTVTVKLNKTAIDNISGKTFTIALTASPVEV